MRTADMSRPRRLKIDPTPAARRADPPPVTEAFARALRHDRDAELGLAEEGYRRILERAPRHAESLHNLGSILKRRGRMSEAESLFRRVLDVRPDAAVTLYELVGTRRYTSAQHEDVTRIRRLLERPRLAESDAVFLHFALGKVFDDCGAFDDAFASYRKGNALRHRESRFDAGVFTRYVDRVIHTFDEALVRSLRAGAHPSELPVYVIGMPRAGTTLVEQILSRHPHVHAAGELLAVDRAIHNLRLRCRAQDDYPDFVRGASPEVFAEEARAYESFLRGLAGERALRVTDKMPYNFKCAGLISVMFARARFVHCVREPRDVCLSNYFQLYLGRHDHTYSLVDLGRYHRQYERLMGHWRRVLPAECLFEVRYEDVVADTASAARALVDFLDLDWDERCLAHERSERVVHTVSAWQVRQPVYAHAVGRWKSYARHLDPLLRALEEGERSVNGASLTTTAPRY